MKFEVRYISRISICTSMQNFIPIAQKLAELWPFNFKMLVTDVRTLVTTESSSKSDDVDLANKNNEKL